MSPNDARAEIIVVGDGLVCVDGKEYHFEQEDKPDYLGYHLNEDFNFWFEQQKQRNFNRNVPRFIYQYRWNLFF